MTQTNSRPRVKKDTIGDKVMTDLYESFDTAQLEDYRIQCINAIELSSGSISTKTSFIDLLSRCNSKKDMLTKVTNYFLAGEGKGV